MLREYKPTHYHNRIRTHKHRPHTFHIKKGVQAIFKKRPSRPKEFICHSYSKPTNKRKITPEAEANMRLAATELHLIHM